MPRIGGLLVVPETRTKFLCSFSWGRVLLQPDRDEVARVVAQPRSLCGHCYTFPLSSLEIQPVSLPSNRDPEGPDALGWTRSLYLIRYVHTFTASERGHDEEVGMYIHVHILHGESIIDVTMQCKLLSSMQDAAVVTTTATADPPPRPPFTPFSLGAHRPRHSEK